MLPNTLSPSSPPRHALGWCPSLERCLPLALGTLLGCGGDAVVTLGVGAPVPVFGDAGQRVRNLNQLGSNERGATLSADLLEIYFASDREGGVGEGDIWHARRAARTDAFGEPELVVELSSPLAEASPAISADGLTLWFASSREGGLGQLDIWRATRGDVAEAWSAPENVAALNSPFNDLPSPPGDGGDALPISSDRDAGAYQVYLAHARAAGFDGAEIEPLSYLWQADASMDDPFLSDDGRLLFFRRAPPDSAGDLYLAWRRPGYAEFIDPAKLPTINADSDERDPFLSADQIRFFFSSAQREDGALDIYATSIALPVFE